MKLELKNIKVNLTFSEETTMFKADLFANGKKIAYAHNDGHGGCTYYDHLEGKREELKKVEEFAKTLPSDYYEFGDEKREIKMNLEYWIDKQVEDFVNAKENAKFKKKMEKQMETNIVFGIPNGTSYRMVGFKSNTKLSQLSQQSINSLVESVKKQLKEGEIILNTNIKF
jgi:hypothetical protein